MRIFLLVSLCFVLFSANAYAHENKFIVIFVMPDTKLATCDGVGPFDNSKEQDIVAFKEMSEKYRQVISEKVVKYSDNVILANLEIYNGSWPQHTCYLPVAGFFQNKDKAVDFCNKSAVSCVIDSYPNSEVFARRIFWNEKFEGKK